ncbi:hypothetical protein Tco_0498112, partial [Tanacetum coccineum]
MWCSRAFQEGLPKIEEQQQPGYSGWKCQDSGKGVCRRSFVSTALDHDYNVELADGRIVGLNTIIRG